MPTLPLSTTLKLVGGLGVAIALALLWHLQGYWHAQATAARATNAALCEAARDAAANRKLDCRDAGTQIRALGTSLANVTAALKRQNAAVDALAKASAQQQAAAAKASQKAEARAAEAERVADRLTASSKAPTNAGCEPSKALQEQWP